MKTTIWRDCSGKHGGDGTFPYMALAASSERSGPPRGGSPGSTCQTNRVTEGRYTFFALDAEFPFFNQEEKWEDIPIRAS